MTPPRLRCRTVPIDDPGPLLAALPRASAGDLLAWVRGADGLVGWGRAASVRTFGESRFADAEAWWHSLVADTDVEDRVGLAGCGPVAFGSFAYSARSPAGAGLVLPRVVLGRRGDVWWRTTVTLGNLACCPAEPSAPPAPRPPGQVSFGAGSLDGAGWQAAVAAALRRIDAGDLDKVVLARDLRVECSSPIDVRWLLRRLAADYGRTWVFNVDGLIGATPEMLVRLERGLVTSRILAGTIRRTGDDEHDLTLAASLARSSKDLEEHEYAVRSVADALASYCTSMSVPESPFVLHLPNVMHLATDVAGRMRNGATSLRLAAALHPSAAVCGTPQAAAEAAIAQLEQLDRGRYAGPVGWMDAAGDGEWGLALRSGEFDPTDPRRMRIFAGCGIVAGSDPADELAESEAKFAPMRTALAG